MLKDVKFDSVSGPSARGGGEALATADLICTLLPLSPRRTLSVLSFCLTVLFLLCPARQLPTSEEPCTTSSLHI